MNWVTPVAFCLLSLVRSFVGSLGPAKGFFGPCKRVLWALKKGSTMAGRGIPIKNAVEVDLLDGMDCELHGYRRRVMVPYWCYIQCERCGRGWIWRLKLGEEGRWTTHCYVCGRSWRENYHLNGGWYYWNPNKRCRHIVE